MCIQKPIDTNHAYQPTSMEDSWITEYVITIGLYKLILSVNQLNLEGPSVWWIIRYVLKNVEKQFCTCPGNIFKPKRSQHSRNDDKPAHLGRTHLKGDICEPLLMPWPIKEWNPLRRQLNSLHSAGLNRVDDNISPVELKGARTS